MQVYVNGKKKHISETAIFTAPFQKKDVGRYAVITDEDISTIRVCFDVDVDSLVIRPQRYGIKYQIIDKNTVELYPDSRYNISVEPNGQIAGSVQLFCGKAPEIDRTKYENIIYFDAGEHFADTLTVDKDNTLVFIAEEATVNGRIILSGCKNVAIDGYGELSHEAYTQRKCLIDVDGCSDVEIRNIVLTSSSFWNLRLLGCDRVHIDNIKIIGYRGNSDGVDVCSSREVLVENIFTRVWDDSLVIKAFDRGDVENVTFCNCVLWNDFARPMEVGVETRADKIHRIRFSDIDIIHSVTGYPVMGIHHGDRAEVYDICFENINIEDTPGSQLFDIRVIQSVWNKDAGMGRVHDVYFKNINVLNNPNHEFLPYHSRMQGYSAENDISNIYFENVKIFGKYAKNAQDLGLQVFDYVNNVNVCATKGPFIEGIKTKITTENYTLRDDGYYDVSVKVSFRNTTDLYKKGMVKLKLSPSWVCDFDGEIRYEIEADGVAEFTKTMRLPAGKYAFSLDSANADPEYAIEFLDLTLELDEDFESCPAYRFCDSYGNSMDDELRLAMKGDLLMIKSELMKKYDITLYAAKPVGKPQPGDILFSIEDTNIRKAPAILLGKNGEYLEGPQIGCPEEISYVFKNYPKVDIKTLKISKRRKDTAIISMSDMKIEDPPDGFLLELALDAKPEKRYEFTLFATPINKATSSDPKVMAHMFVNVRAKKKQKGQITADPE